MYLCEVPTVHQLSMCFDTRTHCRIDDVLQKKQCREMETELLIIKTLNNHEGKGKGKGHPRTGHEGPEGE